MSYAHSFQSHLFWLVKSIINVNLTFIWAIISIIPSLLSLSSIIKCLHHAIGYNGSSWYLMQSFHWSLHHTLNMNCICSIDCLEQHEWKWHKVMVIDYQKVRMMVLGLIYSMWWIGRYGATQLSHVTFSKSKCTKLMHKKENECHLAKIEVSSTLWRWSGNFIIC